MKVCPKCSKEFDDNKMTCDTCSLELKWVNEETYRKWNTFFENYQKDCREREKQREKEEREIKEAKKRHKAPKGYHYLEPRPTSSQKVYVPKCPVCGSSNLNNISGLERGASILTLGFALKKNK